jgi:bleomycin hydrolase
MFQETFHSSNSGALNALLTRKFRIAALEIRRLVANGQDHTLYCDAVMKDVFNVLCKTLGTPPMGAFTWSYLDTKKQYHSVNYQSPQEFYAPSRALFDDCCVLVNDPRHSEHDVLTVEFLGNMIGGRPVRYLNISMDAMRRLAAKSIDCGKAVWFGCDVGKEMLDTFMCVDVKQ